MKPEELQEWLKVPIMQDLLKDEKLKIAKKLLKSGVDKKVIAEATGLKLEEIKKIKL